MTGTSVFRSFGLGFAGLLLLACGGSKPAESPADAQDTDEPSAAPSDSSTEEPGAEAGSDENRFQLNDSDSAGNAHGASESKIKATKTEAALKFVVVNKDKGVIPGIVIALTAPDGKKFFAPETDAAGYTEVLVPVGKDYELTFLSLGRREIAAKVNVEDLPNQNIKLTLRYKRHMPPGPETKVVLSGVNFDTGKAVIRPESLPRLDEVVEYLVRKPKVRIEISGHTDNVGKAATNKALSQRRADACRDYLVQKGIARDRIEAVGYGDERPIASNEQEDGRQKNRRIEANEL